MNKRKCFRMFYLDSTTYPAFLSLNATEYIILTTVSLHTVQQIDFVCRKK